MQVYHSYTLKLIWNTKICLNYMDSVPVYGHLSHVDIEWVVFCLTFISSLVWKIVVTFRQTLVGNGVFVCIVVHPIIFI